MKRTIAYWACNLLLLQACTFAEASTPVISADATITPNPPTSAPIATATKASATMIPVDHVDIPFEGTGDRATSHDHDNALTFESKTVRSGDEFFRNRFERPFTAEDMQYLPYLDIVNFSIASDDKFHYIRISLVDLDDAKSLSGFYGFEIDRNADGRAELLITSSPPYSDEFNADHVTVYFDVNGDVGGNKINRPDEYRGDGFESVIFNLSQNIHPENDSDFAWVRQTADGNFPAIEFAFKKWIFADGRDAFMWSVDSSGSEIDPSDLYLQDSITTEEAGAANVDDPQYPIKELEAFDNTCRVSFGVNITGVEPLGCFVATSEVEKNREPDANLTCTVFNELCDRTKDHIALTP